ncbi:MAG TPA: thioredoxin domain-containing protein [Thermoplasmata archaeon]|nr:thioredoxin domain-containing protein [Thermoplasmata archaeon]
MGENRLAKEKSSYLRSAAHQPVDWHAWGEEAFRKAKAEDRPILLDIGAVWCHWCHVIDRESYEDPTVAKIINERYVAVKVDRDERPDVDARYQQAVQALSGQGGWPLTAFLTPDGKVFYGGTYFPPVEAFGRPSFKSVLVAVADHYRKEKAETVKEADSLHRALAQRLPMVAREPLDEGLLFTVEEQLKSSFDSRNGGFGGAPKFPHPGAMEFVLARLWRSRDDALREIAVKTLTEMALGGVYDQIGGGFHRYSTDGRWIVPHFEKMAYDNAALLGNYVHAYQLTGDARFREIALGIIDWVATTLSDPSRGGFYASQDADVGPEDDGGYFTWTLAELADAVPPGVAKIMALHYDVKELGEMRERPDRNVLFVSEPPEEIARILKMETDAVRGAIPEGRARMLAARNRRTTPFVDRTIYANWNGMFIAAYLEAYAGLGIEPARDFALRTLDHLIPPLYVEGGGFYHQLVDGERRVRGLLDDQVQMARALLAAFEVTANPRYIQLAERLAALLMKYWWDPVLGGFFDLAKDLVRDEGVETLRTPHKPVQDAPTAAPNAVAALVFGKLHALTGNEEYRATQETILKTFAAECQRYGGLFAGTYFQALDSYLNHPAQVVVTGDLRDPLAVELRRAALTTYHPGRSVLAADEGYVPDAVKAMLDSPLAKDGPVAFLCKGTVCAPPTADPEALRKLLSTP